MLLLAPRIGAQDPAPSPAVTAADLAGAWAGTTSHNGETAPFDIELEPGDDGKVLLKLTSPMVHILHAPLGRAPLRVEGSTVHLGPFTLVYDRAAGTLSGTIPEGLAPLYKLPVTLRHVDALDVPARPAPDAPLARPAWTFAAGAPLWPGTSFARGTVYAGDDAGRMHALDSGTGKERWSFAAGGPIRTRAVVAQRTVYFQADDGLLYALDAATGHERWRVRVQEKPILRKPPSDPESRYDRFGADVTVAGGRLFVGTHEGRVLCLEPAHGREVWRFASADSVLAAPAVDATGVYFGSYDGRVYALEPATGREIWRLDTGKPVVSTPALAAGRVIVGSRSYDFLALDAATGEIEWRRYIWFSWVESSAAARDGVVYVGSSDAAAVYAFQATSGRSLWTSDVWGWAWGQPALTARRVYMGTSALGGYPVPHQGTVAALDRATGRMAWRFVFPEEKDKAYGVTGSAAVGDGRVFVAGLDGRVYAFAE